MINSWSNREDKQHLRIVLQTLRDHWHYVESPKCECWLEFVAFLWHIVSKKRIMDDPVQIGDICDWSSRTSNIKIWSFFGLMGLLQMVCARLLYRWNTFDPVESSLCVIWIIWWVWGWILEAQWVFCHWSHTDSSS